MQQQALDTTFAGAQPVASAVAAPASLAAAVKSVSEGNQADLRFLLEDMIDEVVPMATVPSTV